MFLVVIGSCAITRASTKSTIKTIDGFVGTNIKLQSSLHVVRARRLGVADDAQPALLAMAIEREFNIK